MDSVRRQRTSHVSSFEGCDNDWNFTNRDATCSCFAYALAEASREPLLYKGDDFALTDIEAA